MVFLSRSSLRANAAARAAEAARVKADLAPALGLGADDALSVSEIACADPACPGTETVVLVMRVGEPTRAFRIRAACAAVTGEDVARVAEDERRQRAGG